MEGGAHLLGISSRIHMSSWCRGHAHLRIVAVLVYVCEVSTEDFLVTLVRTQMFVLLFVPFRRSSVLLNKNYVKFLF